MRAQNDGDDTGMYGYIGWYVEKNDGTHTSDGLSGSGLTEYTNGLATTLTRNTSTAGKVNCTFSEENINSGIKLVYEASSVRATTGGSGNSRYIRPRAIGIRHVYEVKSASERVEALKLKKEEFGKLKISGNDLSALREALDASKYVLNAYDIYIPVGATSNFRLPEELRNYYVPNGTGIAKAGAVRWKINKYDGSVWNNTSEITTGNILTEENFGNRIQKASILTEVAINRSSSNWYPVSFMNVIMVPGSGPLTAEELSELSADEKKAYRHRFEDELNENTALYQRLVRISFDNDGTGILEMNSENELENYLESNKTDNFTNEVFTTEDDEKVDSYYAFAHPELYEQRGNELKVMKGEYGLYRTLNYPGISRSTQASNPTTVGTGGRYSDYFPAQYNRSLTDRLWEKTEGLQSGYFMYIDASEIPGVITKIPISGLCPNTSLIVNAWVCDVTEGNGRTPANIGFTLKGKNEDGTETILSKYYSGALTTKPSGSGSENAQWQQVSFKFSFSDTDIKNTDEFILEISSNCESSNGADFGIDDISIYSTRPAINAQRKDACESSVLTVSTDYQTLQSNMSWDIDANVIDESELSNSTYRKYRYGLMGDDPYVPVGEVLHSNVGNVYFSFTEINDNGGVGEWVVLNKNLLDYDHIAEMGLQYAMRVAVQTDMNAVGTQNMIPIVQDEALKDEIIMNVRAMNDFLEDIKRGNWKTEGETDIKKENRQLVAELITEFCTLEKSTVAEAIDKEDPLKIKEGSIKTTEIIGNVDGLGDKYEKAVRALYLCLEIPRIRCPWRSEDNTMLYLSEINVHNTDLRFAGEIYYEDNGVKKTAKGEYYVVLFSARQIADGNNLDLDSECALKKRIYVMPSTTIAVETETDDNLIACAGTIQSVNANLQVAEVDAVGNIISPDLKPFDEVFKGAKYTFDWFLGSEEDFQAICSDLNIQEIELAGLQDIIKDLRDGLGDDKSVEAFDVNDVETSSLDENSKKLLKRLLGDGGTDLMLTSGKGKINFRFVKQVFAMPYIPEIPISDGEQDSEGRYWSFCAEGDFITLTENENVPILNVGIPTVSYPTTDFELNRVPLRLGLKNIRSEMGLRIPIQKEIEFGAIIEGESSIHILKEHPNKKEVHLNISGLPVVGTLISLYAENGSVNNNLILMFNDYAKNNLKEGETYSLSIPFGEYIKGESDASDDFIESACEGTANLVIKIVPEYLTWQGDGSGVWYNDDNWNQSTEGELYFDQGLGTSTDDANGSDPDLTKAFAPLYFTKITIPNGEQLTLDEPNIKNVNDIVLDFGDKNNAATENIQYDMAVDNTGTDGSIEVVPYYINKVDQIYFKPEATLMNQHYLLYDTARVEFTMKQNTPYWRASPLKEVYAGDLYAPTGGTQNTPAFNHIVFNTNDYNRWGPAFYQKAWNKAVAYMDSDQDGVPHSPENAIDVKAVKSNWSIEYNDVWVPYPIGKGFYASVEGVAGGGEVTVRLPKADTEYLYYQTKAANNLSPDPKFEDGRRITDENGVVTGGAGQLATEKPTFTRDQATFVFEYKFNGEISLNLDDVYGENSTDVESGEHRHFLVGNPYMTYLDMNVFFNMNQNLEKKFWTLVRNSTSVGTPDVTVWSEANGYHDHTDKTAQSYVAPMTAFFVELSDNAGNDKTIEFTTAMMAAKPTTTDNVYTKSYSASNPILTLTAERGETRSVARLLTSDKGHDEYEASEDAVLLLDSELDAPMVYTVAGDVAAQFNTMQSIKNVPLGIYNKKGDEVTLTISGLSRLVEPLYLYDAWTGKSKELTGDSYQLTVEGESLGRYYLRNEALASELESTISIYSLQPGEIVAASSGAVLRQVRVYSVNGELVTQRSAVGQTACRLSVPRGAIYMIYAEDMKGNSQSVKLRVR